MSCNRKSLVLACTCRCTIIQSLLFMRRQIHTTYPNLLELSRPRKASDDSRICCCTSNGDCRQGGCMHV